MAYMIQRNGEFLKGFEPCAAFKNAVPIFRPHTEGGLMFATKRAAAAAAAKANKCEREVVGIFRQQCGYVRAPLLAEVVGW